MSSRYIPFPISHFPFPKNAVRLKTFLPVAASNLCASEKDKTMTDTQLITQFLNGNSRAFDTLVWRWQTPVYSFVMRYLGEAELAKEVSQKTFIRAHHKLHLLEQTDKFSTWLYQIAVNLCRDELKSRKRRRALPLDPAADGAGGSEVLNLAASADDGPERMVQRGEMGEIINSALSLISPEQREVVIMKEYQGLKFREIALALDISENTAKSRMYYGLKSLRRIFNKWQIDKESISHDM